MIPLDDFILALHDIDLALLQQIEKRNANISLVSALESLKTTAFITFLHSKASEDMFKALESKKEPSWMVRTPVIPEVRLAFYVISLYTVFITWGILQERVTTSKYYTSSIGSDVYIWRYPIVLNFVMTACASATAALVESFLPNPHSKTIPFTVYWKAGLTSALASPIGYHSLRFITYPMMILTKSSKPVPVMAIGALFYRKRYEFHKYISVVLICGGISLFMGFSGKAKAGDVKVGFSFQLFGLSLVLINLLLDGVTSNEQDRLFTKHAKGLTALGMMKGTNGWQALYMGLYLIFTLLLHGHSSDLIQALVMIKDCIGLGRDILIFCGCACLGQLLLFALVKEFGSLVWVTIAVTRQLLTIMISVVLFGHPMASLQWMGVLLVFSGLGLEIAWNYLKKAEKAPTISSSIPSVASFSSMSSGGALSPSPSILKRKASTSSANKSKRDIENFAADASPSPSPRGVKED